MWGSDRPAVLGAATPRSARRPSSDAPSTWWWFLVPLLTLGLGTFPMVFYGAAKLRSRRHRLSALGYLGATLGFFVGVQFTDEQRAGVLDAVLMLLLLVTWLGGVAHVAVLQSRVRSAGAAEPEVDPALMAAERRSARRREARRLQADRPGLAAELRIGRPDLPGRQYDDGGLVEINHVPAEWLVRVLDLTPAVAAEIVEARARCGGFTCPEELVLYCDSMTPDQLGLIRDRLTFVPL